MKILKYNENRQNNWNKKRMEKLYDEYSDFGNLVLEYLGLNYRGMFQDEPYHYNLTEFWFEEDEDNFLNVYYEHGNYSNNSQVNFTFDNEEFQKLLFFMNNPDTYKSSKKFNL